MKPTQLLAEVWAEVPDANCKGLCQDSCGPIHGSPQELALLADRGVHLKPLDAIMADVNANRPPEPCPALSLEGRCTVYDVRPMICRLYGVVGELTLDCGHGCGPTGRPKLTRAESHALLAKAQDAGSWVPTPRRRR